MHILRVAFVLMSLISTYGTQRLHETHQHAGLALESNATALTSTSTQRTILATKRKPPPPKRRRPSPRPRRKRPPPPAKARKRRPPPPKKKITKPPPPKRKVTKPPPIRYSSPPPTRYSPPVTRRSPPPPLPPLQLAPTSASPLPAAAPSPGPMSPLFPTLLTFVLEKEYPHDTTAFTQGLEYDVQCPTNDTCREVLYESTGIYGGSTIREVDLQSGNVLRSRALPTTDFGEGLTRWKDRLLQLTWRSGKVWSYALGDFDDRRERTTPLDDGWGMTNSGTHLIVSDSTANLYFLDPETLSIERNITVKDGSYPVKWLNEMEYIDGFIYANVWQTNCIAIIDTTTGTVVSWALMHSLTELAQSTAGKPFSDSMEVLNGIAWDQTGRRLFVTGKWWPRVYQVRLEEGSGPIGTPQTVASARESCITT